MANPNQNDQPPARSQYHELIAYWETISGYWRRAIEAASLNKKKEAMDIVLELVKGTV